MQWRRCTDDCLMYWVPAAMGDVAKEKLQQTSREGIRLFHTIQFRCLLCLLPLMGKKVCVLKLSAW